MCLCIVAIHPHTTLPIDTLGMALHSARIGQHRRLRCGLALAGPEAVMDGHGLAELIASRYKRCALLLCTLNIVHHAGTPGRLGETGGKQGGRDSATSEASKNSASACGYRGAGLLQAGRQRGPSP